MDVRSQSFLKDRSRWRPFLSRGMAFVVVYLAAFTAFSLGVDVSERDMAGAGLLSRAYYTFGLFVLGGLDLGTPVGGTPIARDLYEVPDPLNHRPVPKSARPG